MVKQARLSRFRSIEIPRTPIRVIFFSIPYWRSIRNFESSVISFKVYLSIFRLSRESPPLMTSASASFSHLATSRSKSSPTESSLPLAVLPPRPAGNTRESSQPSKPNVRLEPPNTGKTNRKKLLSLNRPRLTLLTRPPSLTPLLLPWVIELIE